MPKIESRLEILKHFSNLGSNREKLKYLAKLGALAPSSHNTQPWFFRIGENDIEVLPNFKRCLPASDPTNRELVISLGTALANIAIAAEAYGLKYRCEFYETLGVNIAMAKIFFDSLAPTKEDKVLLSALALRHNNRSDFLSKPIENNFLEQAKDLVVPGINYMTTSDPAVLKDAADVVVDATIEAFGRQSFKEELAEWLRPSLSKYRDGMPGYNIEVPFILSFALPTIIRKADVRKQQAEMARKALSASSAFGVLSAVEDTPHIWVKAGYSFEQLAVHAQKYGMSMSLLTAAIEMGEEHRRLEEIMKVSGRALMFFRLGYPSKSTDASPRLPVEEVIVYKNGH